MDTNFCRFCGTKFNFRPQPQQQQPDPFAFQSPQPYAWKTDEFQTQNEARRTQAFHDQTQRQQPIYQPAPLMHQGNAQFSTQFRCPHCMSTFMPHMERRISTAGWITFAVLLVFFFPLFWIGLLIKEEVPVCSTCNTKLN